MLASQRVEISDMSDKFWYKSVQELGRYCSSRSEASRSSLVPCCAEDSSSPLANIFSPDGSSISRAEPQSQSLTPDRNHSLETHHGAGGSCVTQDVCDLDPKLQAEARVMPGSDMGKTGCIKLKRQRIAMEAISRRDLKQVLVLCGKAVSESDMVMAQWFMDELRVLVSVSGEPVQRLAAYMLEGLVAKVSSSGSSIYKAFRRLEPASAEILSYLYEVCPCFKFGHMSANGAIAEALKNETRIHIIDFGIGQGSQWAALIQALGARPGGPPHIRLTGVFDATAHAHGDSSFVGRRLTRFAEKCNVSLQFDSVVMIGYSVQPEDLSVQPGAAVAVNFAFMLHQVPDESVSTHNHRDRLLRLVKSLSPKVVTLVEQELNANTAPFLPRFRETMDYYCAIFESIDTTLPRNHKQRINVEQLCFARDLVNIIACEGAERIERHELLGKWRSRFMMAGFEPCPLSPLVNATIKALMHKHSDKYRLEERDGALYLGWMDRDLISSCAWKWKPSSE